MSVIAFDGKIIAADRRAIYGDTISTCRKIFKIDDETIVAFGGDLDQGHRLMEWYKGGGKVHDWPNNVGGDSCPYCMFIVVIRGICFHYERTPYPIASRDDFIAFGCGREVALGVMAMGGDAIKAVEIASRFIYSCGNGIDFYQVG